MAKRGQNEGSIYQRNDGRWCATLNLGILNGKRSRKSFYGDTRKEVQEKLTKALNDVQQGLPVISERLTVGQYLERWLSDVVKRKNRPATYQSYEMIVRRHLVPSLGQIGLAKLKTLDVRRLLNAKTDDGLSSRTVQYMHAILRKALHTAVNDQLITRNVASLVEPPRVFSKEVHPLTVTEARKFLDFIAGDRLECLFTVAVSLGLRQGEAMALRPQDVDLEAGKLRVSYSLRRQKGAIYLGEPKTKKGRRTVDLPSVTLNAIANHIARQEEERLLCGSQWQTPEVYVDGKKQQVNFLFTTTVGTPLESRAVTKRFQRILELAGIERHRFHDLRHTAATLLAVQGVHPKAIQSALGWAQASMLDIYTHFVDEMRKEVATKMDEILKAPAPRVPLHSAQKPS